MKGKGKHGFPYRDRGEGKHPIRAGVTGQKVEPYSGDDGRIIGSASQKKGVNKGKTLEHNPCIIGKLPKPSPSSGASVNKLPSGGSTRIT